MGEHFVGNFYNGYPTANNVANNEYTLDDIENRISLPTAQPTSYLNLPTTVAQTPQETHKDLVLSYTKALNYSATPRGSEAELNYVNPQNVELLRNNRLSQSFKQINTVEYISPNGFYYHDEATAEHGRVGLLTSADEEKKKTPSTYWMLACVSFLCCFPVGSFALYKSYQTGQAIRNKDNKYASDSSDVTKFVCVLAIILGTIFISIGSALRLNATYEDGGNLL